MYYNFIELYFKKFVFKKKKIKKKSKIKVY